MFIALFISAIYEVIILYDENNIKKMENEKLEKGKIEAELNILKSKIEPHFLFNSLSTLQNLIKENTPAACQFNRLLSELYQDLLLFSEKDYLGLEQELDLMYKYHNLISVRFPSAVNLSVKLQSVDLQNFLIPPFSLNI